MQDEIHGVDAEIKDLEEALASKRRLRSELEKQLEAEKQYGAWAKLGRIETDPELLDAIYQDQIREAMNNHVDIPTLAGIESTRYNPTAEDRDLDAAYHCLTKAEVLKFYKAVLTIRTSMLYGPKDVSYTWSYKYPAVLQSIQIHNQQLTKNCKSVFSDLPNLASLVWPASTFHIKLAYYATTYGLSQARPLQSLRNLKSGSAAARLAEHQADGGDKIWRDVETGTCD